MNDVSERCEWNEGVNVGTQIYHHMSILLCFADEEHIKDKNLYVIMKSNKKIFRSYDLRFYYYYFMLS